MSTKSNKTVKNSKSVKNSNAHNAEATIVDTVVATAPSESAPPAPVGFDPTTMKAGRGAGVAAVLGGYATSVADEMRASPTFVEDFGSKQSPEVLADAFTNAAAWRAAKVKAKQWFAYVRYGDATAWKTVKREVERLGKSYKYAVACDPTVEARNPKLAAMFTALSAASLKAGATRKENAKAAKAAAEAAQSPSSSSSATATQKS